MNRNESVAFDIVLQKAKIHFVYFGKKKNTQKMDARIIPLAAINRPAERWVVAVGPNSSYLSSGSVLQLPSWEPAVSMASLQPEETCSSYWRQACDRLTSHSVTNTACHSQWMKPTKQPLVSTTQPVTDQTN